MQLSHLIQTVAVAVLLALPSAGCRKKPIAEQPAATPAPAPAAATPAPEPVAVATPEPVNKSAQVIVLCYHRFEKSPRDSLAISPQEFERQLQEIKDAGIEVISMDDFLAWKRGEKSIPEKSAVITIDDGYISGYSDAWPILKKFDYPFTMNVYLKYINAGGRSITWDQLAEMRDAGVDIASHSVSHSDLKSKKGRSEQQYLDFLREEIVTSKESLEKQLGIKVTTFAYPYGRYSDQARKLIEEAGYEAAFTVYGQKIGHDSPNDILGRYAIESTKPEVFKMALNFGGGTSGAGVAAASVAPSQMQTQPAEGETVKDAKPLIVANLSTLGEVDPKSVKMRLSGVGVVPAEYDAETKQLSYQVTQKLRHPSYTVIVSATANGKRVESRWSFNYDPSVARGGAAKAGGTTEATRASGG